MIIFFASNVLVLPLKQSEDGVENINPMSSVLASSAAARRDTWSSEGSVAADEHSAQNEAGHTIEWLDRCKQAVAATLGGIQKEFNAKMAQAGHAVWYRIDDTRDAIACKINVLVDFFRPPTTNFDDDVYNGN